MEILVDSNILIFSVNTSENKCYRARDYIRRNQEALYVAHQNIFEMLRVVSHRTYHHDFSTQIALSAVNSLIKCLNVISPTPITDKIALNLIEKYQISGNQIFDAYLAATMLSHDIRVIATDNVKDFEIFKEVQVFNPFKVAEAKMVHGEGEAEYVV